MSIVTPSGRALHQRPGARVRDGSDTRRFFLEPLALKLRDKGRRSHIDDFNCDEALGLVAGLNVPPKKSFATASSYRAVRDQQRGLLQGWVQTLAPVLFAEPEGFSLDFHPIPF